MGINNSSSWEEKYCDQNGLILVAPKTSGAKIMKILGFEKKDGIYESFVGKNVADIGSGFGGLVFELEKSCDNINLIDPVYSSSEISDLLNRDIGRIKRSITELNINVSNCSRKINETKSALNDLFMQAPSPKNQDEINYFQGKESNDQKLFGLYKKNLNDKSEVIDGLIKWNDRGFKNSDKIKFIGNVGENTTLEANSQDIVFLTHIINKDSVNSEKLISEALRITKFNGKIFIIDNDDISESVQSILSGLNYKQEEKDNLKIIKITK